MEISILECRRDTLNKRYRRIVPYLRCMGAQYYRAHRTCDAIIEELSIINRKIDRYYRNKYFTQDLRENK